MDLTPRELWLLIRAMEATSFRTDGDAYYADLLLRRLREMKHRLDREDAQAHNTHPRR
jgi:hypothetical protein